MSKQNNNKNQWKPLGAIGKPYGLKGFFYVHGRGDLFPESFEEVLIGTALSRAKSFMIRHHQVLKGRSVLALEGVQTRTELEPMIGMQIWGSSDIHENPLDALVGLEVLDTTGRSFALVTGHYTHGAAPNLSLKRLAGPHVLDIPFVDAYFDLKSFQKSGVLRLSVALDVFEDMWETPKGKA